MDISINNAKIAFAVIVMMMRINYCDGIYCYLCQSESDPECGSVFTLGTDSDVYVGQCQTSCFKFVARRGDYQAISRGCLPQMKTIPRCRHESDGDITGTMCTCNKDFCNVAPRAATCNMTFMLLVILDLFI